LLNAINKNKDVHKTIIYTTLPQRYGHMSGIPRYEKQGNTLIVRFYTPQHNNSFFRQFIAYCFFAVSALKHAYINRKNYNSIFATSSRLGTGFLGFLVSKITRKPLFLDIRDIFSDNLSSLPLFKGYIGKSLINLFSQIESINISHASWANFVSPGFFSYSHIEKLHKNINLFTNGIDDIFINNRNEMNTKDLGDEHEKPLKIIYAGNIGISQGMELIVLPLAKHYNNEILIQLIGDGSSVSLIKAGIKENGLDNIRLIPPVNRSLLIDYYNNADIFLLQLNDIPAFEKVLPSKIFDYGSFDKPMMAGVKGVAKSFINENLPSAFLFNPGDIDATIKYIDSIMKNGHPIVNNSLFIRKYSRKSIMIDMLSSIVSSFKYHQINTLNNHQYY